MKRHSYTCIAKPLGQRGGICGAPAREHNIQQPVIVSPITGKALPQHKFVAQKEG